MGYRHMCRLFSGPPLAKIKSLTGFDWFMRIDTDSFLLGPVEVDLFSHAAANNVKYGWLGAYMDQEYFVTGLWETTRQWMKTEGLSEKELNQWLEPHLKMQKKMKEDDAPAVTSRGTSQTEESATSDELAVAAAFTDGDYDDVRFCFATNFFLIKTDWMTSPLFARYHKWLDDAEGFYRYRWGDACVHFLAVASMLDRQEETYRYNHDVPYWHQGTVLMPEYPGYFSNSNF
uniref:Nucleotide-diphospho-sugar transferase domain-containing protein n=1 Tax=Octactis speculum TaxID=3111310 RepID=A0A7S2GY75_9STRA|mmetsp:Transcript_59346/g.81060  ORF Transcript_59346/g.81060 Transcript_59346/m.81060 type:complete len:231 (+) Transcript_59346:3-695(+)